MSCNRIIHADSRWLATFNALTLLFCALVAGGCQNFQIPRIDPSGERLFSRAGDPNVTPPYVNTPYGMAPAYDPNMPGAQSPLPGTTVIAPPVYSAPTTPAPSSIPPGISGPMVQSPLQTPQPVIDPATTVPTLPGGTYAAPISANPANLAAPTLLGGVAGPPQPGLTIHPARLVHPVGGEVVMIASLCGADGFMVTGENVEWMISRDGVGSFISPGERGSFECLNRWRGLPRKVDNTFVLNTTVRKQLVLDRGTPVPFDDVQIQPGQAWVTVSSPVEGTTHLTAFAPNVPQWDRRQQSATIYWVDAEWVFPPPAINPVGTKHAFVTSVSRRTDGSPIAGWIVRYEIAGGPAALWEASGTTVIEVPTNELGQATAQLMQTSPAAGTNQVNVQIIRPSDANGGGRIVIGSGTTQKTWTQSNICIETIGPLNATVGSAVNYRLEVSNPSSAIARNVVVTDQPPRTLTLTSSSPTADASPSGQEWRLGNLSPGQRKVIEVYYKVNQAGNFNYCASATAEGGLSATDCVTTNAEGSETRPLDVRVTGPSTAIVGSRVEYTIEVVNVGTTAVSGLLVTDTFDPGLEHSAASSPIERDLPDLQPGKSQQFKVAFQVTRAGQLCQQVEVRGNGNARASNRTCLTATTTASPSDRRIEEDGGVTQPNRPERSAPLPGASPGAAFSVSKTGPVRRRVGEKALFMIEVTNTGSVPLSNIRIEDNYDTNLEPTGATDGYVISGGSLVWTQGSLEPGRSIKREIECKCLRAAASACNRVSVSVDGLDKQGDEACLEVSAENDASDQTPPPISPPIKPGPSNSGSNARGGIGAGTGLTVSVTEQVDPVRVGGQTTYDIVVSNKSETSDKQVKVIAKLPTTMTLTTSEGRTRPQFREGAIEWEPIAELRAGESVAFKVVCRAIEAGEGRLFVEVTSEAHRTPVRAEEPTLVTK